MVVDVEYLKGRIREVREVVGELRRFVSKAYSEMSLDEKYSMRYHVVVLTEALGGLCLHIAMEDLGCEPVSYAECFKLLESRGVAERAEELVRMVRLRNLLVHRYWSIEDAKVYEAVKRDFRCVEDLIGRVERKYGL